MMKSGTNLRDFSRLVSQSQAAKTLYYVGVLHVNDSCAPFHAHSCADWNLLRFASFTVCVEYHKDTKICKCLEYYSLLRLIDLHHLLCGVEYHKRIVIADAHILVLERENKRDGECSSEQQYVYTDEHSSKPWVKNATLTSLCKRTEITFIPHIACHSLLH